MAKNLAKREEDFKYENNRFDENIQIYIKGQILSS